MEILGRNERSSPRYSKIVNVPVIGALIQLIRPLPCQIGIPTVNVDPSPGALDTPIVP